MSFIITWCHFGFHFMHSTHLTTGTFIVRIPRKPFFLTFLVKTAFQVISRRTGHILLQIQHSAEGSVI